MVLVVDDDAHILRFLSMNLEQDGFDVILAENGQQAVEHLRRKMPDIAIVDLLLPDVHGFELSDKIKSYLDIPVLILTAVGAEESIVEGLEKHADDYIVKPFRYRELRARINRLLKRSRHLLPSRDPMIVSGDLSLDFVRHTAVLKDKELNLTPMECRLLACLARTPNKVVSRDQLVDEVWPDGDGEPLRLKVAVHRLRVKIEEEPGRPRYLLNHRGRGYLLSTA